MMKNSDEPFDYAEIKELLDEKADLYNRIKFIESDPVSIPHLFDNEDDIAISGFLTATIAWGQRVTLIRNARILVEKMDMAPADFVRNFQESDLEIFNGFVHRTFNEKHCKYFLRALQRMMLLYGNLEKAFENEENTVFSGIVEFRKRFLLEEDNIGVSRHVANPEANSAAKRLNMFLRWMIRKDNRGVDFGLWNVFKQEDLICPLDVHSGGVARKLGILNRKQDDWQAAEELTRVLKSFDANDPVKYDYALFGLGVFENYRKLNALQ
ncbi:MAG: TIGR02757 family protein [Bacteroidia bacterium]